MACQLAVAGKPVKTATIFEVVNPATEGVVGTCPLGSVAEIDAAVVAARAAFPVVALPPDADRVAGLNQIVDLIKASAADLSRIVTKEQGKPHTGPGTSLEAEGAVGWSRVTMGLPPNPEVLIDEGEEHVEIHRVPVSVAASIAPMGGVKQSGIGVEFSEEGLREYTTVQVLSIAK